MEQEINILLKKIDSDSKKLVYLENKIEQQNKEKDLLEKRIKMLEDFRDKSNQQQSRILRERDGIVREMSVEIDSISNKLQNELSENISWKKKYIKLERLYEELEIDFFNLKDKFDKTDKIDKNNMIEKKEFNEVLEMYEKTKKENLKLMQNNKNQNKMIMTKGSQIIKQYNQIKKGLNTSQQEVKIAIAESFRSHKLKSELLSKPVKQQYEDIIIDLIQKNLDIKKLFINVIKTCKSKHLKNKNERKKILNINENNPLKGSILSFSNNLIDDIPQNFDDMAFKSIEEIMNHKNTIESAKSYNKKSKNAIKRQLSQNDKKGEYDSFNNLKRCESLEKQKITFNEFMNSPHTPSRNGFNIPLIQMNSFNPSKKIILTELEKNNEYHEKTLNEEFITWMNILNCENNSANQTKVKLFCFKIIFSTYF